MRWPLTTNKQLLQAFLVGVVTAALFRYLAPRSAVSTLAHSVLQLPGPGAGIGLIYGPAISFSCLAAYGIVGTRWAAFVGSLGAALIWLFPSSQGLPAPHFLLPALGVVLVGSVMQLLLCGAPPGMRKLIISAVLGSLTFLVYYWLAVFPQLGALPAFSQRRWVSGESFPVLLLVAVGAGAVFGGLLPIALLKALGLWKAPVRKTEQAK